MFQCGITQRKVLNNFWDSLEGVAPTDAEVGCGKTL